ncbi:MAG: hypothetical protein PHR06_08560 [Candidatus Cloacimonetes bacterium]|nr:hypothetical protein [Candidatus Cloacimonadota bacterium]
MRITKSNFSLALLFLLILNLSGIDFKVKSSSKDKSIQLVREKISHKLLQLTTDEIANNVDTIFHGIDIDHDQFLNEKCYAQIRLFSEKPEISITTENSLFSASVEISEKELIKFTDTLTSENLNKLTGRLPTVESEKDKLVANDIIRLLQICSSLPLKKDDLETLLSNNSLIESQFANIEIVALNSIVLKEDREAKIAVLGENIPQTTFPLIIRINEKELRFVTDGEGRTNVRDYLVEGSNKLHATPDLVYLARVNKIVLSDRLLTHLSEKIMTFYCQITQLNHKNLSVTESLRNTGFVNIIREKGYEISEDSDFLADYETVVISEEKTAFGSYYLKGYGSFFIVSKKGIKEFVIDSETFEQFSSESFKQAKKELERKCLKNIKSKMITLLE